GYRQRGSDPERLLDTCIEMDNAVIGDHPGVTFGLHICRGNNQSMFYASGGYEPIGERVFRRTRFQRFLLEYDDERSGSFEPLRAVPADRIVVLGLVRTKKPRLETMAELTRLKPGEWMVCGWAQCTSTRLARSSPHQSRWPVPSPPGPDGCAWGRRFSSSP